MFVYKTLCEYLFYSESELNSKDSARNLLGLLDRRSVCAGIALIYKEALDRIGIPCYYQNKQHYHSWNVIELDGIYHGVDLTYDITTKQDNQCGFRFFCRKDQEDFYAQEGHSLEGEKEEMAFPLKSIPEEELERAYHNISKSRIIQCQTAKVGDIETVTVGSKNFDIIDGSPFYAEEKLATYIRKDKSSFVVLPTGNEGKGMKEYIYLEYRPQRKCIKATKIYSEMDLLSDEPSIRDQIANELLSSNRITEKVNGFNGYVGYIGENGTRYYNANIEENIIHKYR